MGDSLFDDSSQLLDRVHSFLEGSSSATALSRFIDSVQSSSRARKDLETRLWLQATLHRVSVPLSEQDIDEVWRLFESSEIVFSPDALLRFHELDQLSIHLKKCLYLLLCIWCRAVASISESSPQIGKISNNFIRMYDQQLAPFSDVDNALRLSVPFHTILHLVWIVHLSNVSSDVQLYRKQLQCVDFPGLCEFVTIVEDGILSCRATGEIWNWKHTTSLIVFLGGALQRFASVTRLDENAAASLWRGVYTCCSVSPDAYDHLWREPFLSLIRANVRAILEYREASDPTVPSYLFACLQSVTSRAVCGTTVDARARGLFLDEALYVRSRVDAITLSSWVMQSIPLLVQRMYGPGMLDIVRSAYLLPAVCSISTLAAAAKAPSEEIITYILNAVEFSLQQKHRAALSAALSFFIVVGKLYDINPITRSKLISLLDEFYPVASLLTSVFTPTDVKVSADVVEKYFSVHEALQAPVPMDSCGHIWRVLLSHRQYHSLGFMVEFMVKFPAYYASNYIHDNEGVELCISTIEVASHSLQSETPAAKDLKALRRQCGRLLIQILQATGTAGSQNSILRFDPSLLKTCVVSHFHGGELGTDFEEGLRLLGHLCTSHHKGVFSIREMLGDDGVSKLISVIKEVLQDAQKDTTITRSCCSFLAVCLTSQLGLAEDIFTELDVLGSLLSTVEDKRLMKESLSTTCLALDVIYQVWILNKGGDNKDSRGRLLMKDKDSFGPKVLTAATTVVEAISARFAERNGDEVDIDASGFWSVVTSICGILAIQFRNDSSKAVSAVSPTLLSSVLRLVSSALQLMRTSDKKLSPEAVNCWSSIAEFCETSTHYLMQPLARRIQVVPDDILYSIDVLRSSVDCLEDYHDVQTVNADSIRVYSATVSMRMSQYVLMCLETLDSETHDEERSERVRQQLIHVFSKVAKELCSQLRDFFEQKSSSDVMARCLNIMFVTVHVWLDYWMRVYSRPVSEGKPDNFPLAFDTCRSILTDDLFRGVVEAMYQVVARCTEDQVFDEYFLDLLLPVLRDALALVHTSLHTLYTVADRKQRKRTLLTGDVNKMVAVLFGDLTEGVVFFQLLIESIFARREFAGLVDNVIALSIEVVNIATRRYALQLLKFILVPMSSYHRNVDAHGNEAPPPILRLWSRSFVLLSSICARIKFFKTTEEQDLARQMLDVLGSFFQGRFQVAQMILASPEALFAAMWKDLNLRSANAGSGPKEVSTESSAAAMELIAAMYGLVYTALRHVPAALWLTRVSNSDASFNIDVPSFVQHTSGLYSSALSFWSHAVSPHGITRLFYVFKDGSSVAGLTNSHGVSKSPRRLSLLRESSDGSAASPSRLFRPMEDLHADFTPAFSPAEYYTRHWRTYTNSQKLELRSLLTLRSVTSLARWWSNDVLKSVKQLRGGSEVSGWLSPGAILESTPCILSRSLKARDAPYSIMDDSAGEARDRYDAQKSVIFRTLDFVNDLLQRSRVALQMVCSKEPSDPEQHRQYVEYILELQSICLGILQDTTFSAAVHLMFFKLATPLLYEYMSAADNTAMHSTMDGIADTQVGSFGRMYTQLTPSQRVIQRYERLVDKCVEDLRLYTQHAQRLAARLPPVDRTHMHEGQLSTTGRVMIGRIQHSLEFLRDIEKWLPVSLTAPISYAEDANLSSVNTTRMSTSAISGIGQRPRNDPRVTLQTPEESPLRASVLN